MYIISFRTNCLVELTGCVCIFLFFLFVRFLSAARRTDCSRILNIVLIKKIKKKKPTDIVDDENIYRVYCKTYVKWRASVKYCDMDVCLSVNIFTWTVFKRKAPVGFDHLIDLNGPCEIVSPLVTYGYGCRVEKC